MADAALFIGWGVPVRGREAKAAQVFNESLQFWAGLQQSNRIESFETFLLQPHGGDLGGFALLKGTPEQLDRLEASDDHQRTVTRAGLIVEGLGVVRARTGQLLVQQMATFQQSVAELA